MDPEGWMLDAATRERASVRGTTARNMSEEERKEQDSNRDHQPEQGQSEEPQTVQSEAEGAADKVWGSFET